MEEIYGINHSSTTADHEYYVDKLALMASPENDLMMMSDQPADDHEYHHYHHYGQYSMIHHQHNRSNISPVLGSEEFVFQSGPAAASINDVHHHHHRHHQNNSNNNQRGHDQHELAASSHHAIIKAKIASHPSYPKLLDAYIDCQKVGAPPEIVSLLDEIRRENDLSKQQEEEEDAAAVSMCSSSSLVPDPELDEFMETYYDILVKYKTDLSRPFDEAISFINSIETQLGNLCNDEGGLSSDDELSGGEIEIQEGQTTKSEDRELKDRLLRRYGGHITSLKVEFSKKKKMKGKLPKEAKQTLFNWWNSHHNWPYPTEADKISLAESTGLDQKQINNWFINQRKRHWKSSESMQRAMMNSLSAHHFFTDD